MIAGIVRLEESTEGSLGVLWTIEKLDEELEKNNILQSDSFIFGRQKWRMLLAAIDLMDKLYIDISLSRITVSDDETPISPLMRWNLGILDKDGIPHYDRSGFLRLETVCKEWMPVADWSGPEFTHLSGKKDLYMPDDKLTVAVNIRWDSGFEMMTTQDLCPKQRNPDTSFNDLLINVKDTMFHVRSSILAKVSEVLSAQILCSKCDGEKDVMEFPDFDPKAFKLFLSFACLGEIETEELTDEIIEEVYYIAYIFDVPKLKETCVRRILSTLDIFSVCSVIDFAEKYRDEKLKEKSTEFFIKNAHKILHTSSWLAFLKTRTTVANGLLIRCLRKQNEF